MLFEDFFEKYRQEGVELTAAEMARLIYRHKTATLTDKHHALQQIIDTLPDEQISTSDFEPPRPRAMSLHELLREYVAEQKRLEAEFFTTEPEVVYLVELNQTETGENWNADEPSLSWEACARKLSDYFEWHEKSGPWQAAVTKYYPKQYLNGFMKELTAYFNEMGELLEISSRMQIPLPRYRDLSWKMNLLPQAAELPHPFRPQRGDVLHLTPGAGKKYPKLPQGPLLVLEEPSDDQTVFVFFLDSEGRPEKQHIKTTLLQEYHVLPTNMRYLLLKEIGKAMKNGDAISNLDSRIGSAFTTPISFLFPLE